MNISAALSEISSYGEFFTITVGGAGDGWQPVHRFYDNGCADLIDATVQRYDTADLRIGASLVQFSHSSRLWSPVLACALGHGVVPDLARLERADDAARLRLPDPIGEPVDRHHPPSDLLYRIVVQQHLEPLAAGLRVKMASGLCSAMPPPHWSRLLGRCSICGPICASRPPGSPNHCWQQANSTTPE